MAELVHDCPRCAAKSITFDVKDQLYLYEKHDWQDWWEVFAICRACRRSTVFVLAQSINAPSDTKMQVKRVGGPSKLPLISLENFYSVERHVSIADFGAVDAPQHVPDAIKTVFEEGARSLAVKCPNAAGTMFRLCVDLATESRLPVEGPPDARTRRDLGLRLPWLFDNGKLPEDLRGLASCIKDDGNDGAHRGTLTDEDANDLLDFAVALLGRLYTEPARIDLARQRREDRRKPKV